MFKQSYFFEHGPANKINNKWICVLDCNIVGTGFVKMKFLFFPISVIVCVQFSEESIPEGKNYVLKFFFQLSQQILIKKSNILNIDYWDENPF